MVERKSEEKIEVELYAIPGTPYPWRFRIYWKGQWWEFLGTPNYCQTKHQARMRAWYRMKWMRDGTFLDRYHSS